MDSGPFQRVETDIRMNGHEDDDEEEEALKQSIRRREKNADLNLFLEVKWGPFAANFG